VLNCFFVPEKLFQAYSKYPLAYSEARGLHHKTFYGRSLFRTVVS